MDDEISNFDLINEFRDDNRGLGFDDRIPDPTKTSLEDSLAGMLQYPEMWNSFHHFMINRIGLTTFKNKVWTNKLGEFKGGKLTFGRTVQEVMGGLIKAREYVADENSTEKDIWGQARLDIKTAFHTVNREDKYKTTINDSQLKHAVVNEGELARLMAVEMGALSNSDQHDEFLIMCQLFSEYERNNGFYKIQVPDLSALDATEATAKKMLEIMIAQTEEMTFYHSYSNPLGMPNFIAEEDAVWFMTPQVKAALDVQALAAAFNIDYLKNKGRIVTIPKARMNIMGIQAILTTRHFFIVHDTVLEHRSIQDPSQLTTNFWWHHHGIYSVSLFEPAIAFTSEEVAPVVPGKYPVTAVGVPTLTDWSGDTITALVRGQVYKASATVTTTPPSKKNTSVGYVLTGALDSHTRIDNDGILHISPWEESTAIKLKTVSTWFNPDDPQAVPKESAEVEFTIPGAPVIPWPVPANSPRTAMRMVEGEETGAEETE